MLKLTLDNDAILDAITQYVSKQGISITDKVVEVTLRTGRKGNGSSAEITITDKKNPEKEVIAGTPENNDSLFETKKDV